MRPLVVALLSFFPLLIACNRGDAKCELDPEVAKIAAPVQVERLEGPFFQLKTEAEAKRFLHEHRLFADQFLQRRQYPSEEMLVQTMLRLSTNPKLQQFAQQTATTFKDTDQLKSQLKPFFQHVRYYFPTFRAPAVTTFVSGLSQDLFVNDSLMVLGLDFFVGSKAKYLPNVPQYILRRYTPEHLMPTVALAVSSKYNQHTLTNQTMLGEMVQFGKSLYFAEKTLPCTPDSLLIGYTAKELAGAQFNEGKIWAHFIEKNLLYNTTPFTIQKYVGERPDVPEIDKTCPGRIGAWMGWQIVRKYMSERPNVTLAQLMAEKNPQLILTASHYRPRRK